jgi:hypothetical protein
MDEDLLALPKETEPYNYNEIDFINFYLEIISCALLYEVNIGQI